MTRVALHPDQGRGSIGVIGSASASRPQPGAPAYAAAEPGVITLARTASSVRAVDGGYTTW